MSLLATIFSKIFPPGHPATAGAAPSAPSPTSNASASGATGSAGAQQSTTATAQQQVDVEAVLNGLAQKSSQKLNWRTSIVDLMKLVGLDSSLEARKALAHELNYSGDTNDSATMNIWLHKQVMKKIAENGGKVPDELKH